MQRPYNQFRDLDFAIAAYLEHVGGVGDTKTSYDLAKKFGVSSSTVRRRMEIAAEQGLVECVRVPTHTKHGRLEYSSGTHLKLYRAFREHAQDRLKSFLESVG